MKTNFMVFIAGDNNLDAHGVSDIEEMLEVADTGDVTILVQQDQSGSARDSGAKRYVIRNGQKEQTIHLGEINTGDASVVTDFFLWGVTNFEAERNIAVLWNHGGGTRDELLPGYENAAASVRSMNPNPTLGHQTSFFSQESRMKQVRDLMLEYQVENEEPVRSISDEETRSILFDDESRDFLDNIELKKVFENIGHKFDIIGFDACLMSMLEVVYQLRDHAELVVGSEELEPGNGWDYTAIITYLAQNPTASNEEISQKIIESFISSYSDPSLKLTLSAMRTANLELLSQRLNDFALAILKNEERIRRAFLAIVDDTQTFDYANNEQIYRDLKHFVLLIKENYDDNEEIVESADALITAIDELVVMNQTANFTDAHGVSVYLPLMPTMSKFALKVFSALDINQEGHAPLWFKLFKQIGNLDREPNHFFEEEEDDIFNFDEE
ncbi:MAG TPA: hypothetical protein ENK82_07850 [Campylobacterales bacterium]|nr:hypothetical protein [Campylobacterales bacterium]HHS93245.1 hypothetical protein [Campylobacterales bacterium]